VGFGGAVFSGGRVDFGHARFSGGTVDFTEAADWSPPPELTPGPAGRCQAARGRGPGAGITARGQETQSCRLSNSRRVPECACGRPPSRSDLDQGLRSWTPPSVSF
jgi:hypothetical protein